MTIKNKLGAFARNVYPIRMVFVTNREWPIYIFKFKLSLHHQIIAEIATTVMLICFAVPIIAPN